MGDVEEEPKNMVKLVFKEKRGDNEETEVTSGQPQNEVFRSLSATVSAEEESEINVMLVDEIGEMELPCLDHLLTWAATASPSDRLKLMNNMAEVQAKLFNIHMK